MRTRQEISPQFYIDWVRSKGGLGFIAHPDHEGALRFHVKQHPWNDWSVTGYTGIGIWDFMTDCQSRLKGYPSALLSYYFPAYRLCGPKKETLERWDELNRTRKVVGIGELDNHETVKKLLGIQFHIFPFSEAFRFIRTHILTEAEFLKEDELDRGIILSALRRGRAYVALEYFENAKGFSFVIMDESEVATMGDEFLLDELAIVQIGLPAKGKIRLIKDGKLFREAVGRELTCGIDEPGIYRVEVYLMERRSSTGPGSSQIRSTSDKHAYPVHSVYPVLPVKKSIWKHFFPDRMDRIDGKDRIDLFFRHISPHGRSFSPKGRRQRSESPAAGLLS